MQRDGETYNSISDGYVEAAVQAGYIGGDVHNNINGTEQLAAAWRQIKREEEAQQRAERERVERARQQDSCLGVGLLGLGVAFAALSTSFDSILLLYAGGACIVAALFIGMNMSKGDTK